jgi:hypothetical protein
MKYQFGLSILVLAMFVSCVKVKKKDDVEADHKPSGQTLPPLVQSVTALSVLNLKIKYQGQPSPNQYAAEISWPIAPVKCMYRIIGDKNTSSETTENSIIINELSGGVEQKIIFEQYEVDTQKRLASFDVILLPPEDLVFDGVVNLVENTEKKVERLFLTASAQVYTNQFNLKIMANNIYSEFGAIISNFPDGAVGDMELHGLSGGKIEISSDSAIGNLLVILNAQRGGQGKWGWPGSDSTATGPACLPNSGADSGDSGSLFFTLNDSKDFSLTPHMIVVEGGKVGEVIPTHQHTVTSQYRSVIKIPYKPETCEGYVPANGKSGRPGQICTKMNLNENFKCEKF